MSWRGHWQTIVPRILARTPRDLPVRRLWETSLVDERVGRVAVRGRYSEGSGGPGPCILLHGLGGSPDSPYVLDTQAALHAAGRSVLALALRGTLGPPDDFYHAGLTADLERAIEALAAETGRKVDVIGFSLGGHVALRLALDPPEALGRVVTVCAPLDLRACCQTLDRRRSWIYRRHVLSGLKAHYRALAERGPVPTPWERIRRVRRIVEWDQLSVVPRFGFRDTDDYYRQCSVGPELERLKPPVWMVIGAVDPMVPLETLRSFLGRLPRNAEVLLDPGGGHITGFRRGAAEVLLERDGD